MTYEEIQPRLKEYETQYSPTELSVYLKVVVEAGYDVLRVTSVAVNGRRYLPEEIDNFLKHRNI